MYDPNANQDRQPNFRDATGKLHLVRCFACDQERGIENWGPSVAKGNCVFCGWREKAPVPLVSISKNG